MAEEREGCEGDDDLPAVNVAGAFVGPVVWRSLEDRGICCADSDVCPDCKAV